MAITFLKASRIIFVTSPQNEVTMQDLIDAIRVYEADLENHDIPKIADASGKEDLGGGVLVGITVKLYDWKLQFEARPGPTTEVVDVTGGNLVAVDDDFTNPSANFVNPIEPSNFVTVTKTSSASATIAELQITDLKFLIESMYISHSATGRTIYWDPVNGNDGFPGDSPDRAVATFDAAQALATPNANDVVFCVNDRVGGSQTVVDANITITVNSLRVRGPGRGFLLRPTSGNVPVIDIQANNVEVSSLQIDASGYSSGGPPIGVKADGRVNTYIKDIWLLGPANVGFYVNDAQGLQIERSFAEGCISHGFVIDGTSQTVFIKESIARVNGGSGICVAGSTGTGVSLEGNLVNFNQQYGIDIQPAASEVSVHADNFVSGNIVDQIRNAGTNTQVEDFVEQVSLFNGQVTIDAVDGNPFGTAFPLGTPSFPVATWAQAGQIAQAYGFDTYRVEGDLTIPAGTDLSDTNWIGGGQHRANLNLNDAFGNRIEMRDMTITGNWVSGATQGQHYVDCVLTNVRNLAGNFEHCHFEGEVAIDPSADRFQLIGVHADSRPAIIDFQGTTAEALIYAPQGKFEVKNITQGTHYWYAGNTSDVYVGPTNTGGTLHVHDQAERTVADGVGTIVHTFLVAQAVLDQLQANHLLPDTIGESIGIGGDGSGGGGSGGACDDPSKIYVDHNYGGKNNLVYVLDSKPVADATIEVFLYDDYISGKRDGSYRIGNSRQRADGSWAIPFYLDPQDYVLQFYRLGIAGPDAYKLVVSETESEISFQKLPDSATGLVGPATPPIQTKTVVKTVTDTAVEGLDQFAGVGTVYVDHNYGGTGALTYVINGTPVNGADILIYNAADYNAGNRSNDFIVAASRQLSNGQWQQAVRLNPGNYKIQFYKQGVAGPDTFDLVVE